MRTRIRMHAAPAHTSRVPFGLTCMHTIYFFFFFLTSPEGAGIPFGETFRSPEGYMHTEGVHTNAPKGHWFTLRYFYSTGF